MSTATLIWFSAVSVMAHGTPREVLTQPDVVAAYVGDTFAAQLALGEIESAEHDREVGPAVQTGGDR